MAVDVDGFKIEISADVVKKITDVDDAINRIQSNAGNAARGIKDIKTALDGINAAQITAVADAVQRLSDTKVGAGFSQMKSDTQTMLQNVTDMVTKLSSIKGLGNVTKETSSTTTKKDTTDNSASKEKLLTEQQIVKLLQDQIRVEAESTTFKVRATELSQKELSIMMALGQKESEITEMLQKQASINPGNYYLAQQQMAAKKEAAEQRAVAAQQKANQQAEKNARDYVTWWENAIAKKEAAEQRAVAAQQKANADAAKLYQQKNYASNTTLSGAINFAGTANTLNRLTTAQKYLKEAMAAAKPHTAEWQAANKTYQETKRRIDEIRKAMGEFRNEQNRVMDISGQLARKLALMFSVSAIQNYIKQMVQVRAQFELQRVALGAILQDKDKANEVFRDIQRMALESPFSIMQLERATKQVAAFGVEAEKLKPTVKMLSDMSAGLGVDVQRLILVFGHMKARNYLEGCLGLGTPIKMSDGSIKRVEDITAGELIMGDDDTPRTVKQVIRGNEQMYKVSYPDGSFRCNEKHILTLYNTQKAVIEDVYVLDYLQSPDVFKGVKRINGRFEYVEILVTKDIVDDYYGFVIDKNRRFQLGDGTVTHNTMVRQFTNAGFNVLGELAKYYTEIENKIVSVGEVQERVKKKMVTFEDVEEVLKRVTSAGGMFYDMQAKQADSLWGQMQRIGDAYDLMLNDIGQSNQGVISKVLVTVRMLINNWRQVIPVIEAVITSFLALKVAAGGAALWSILSSTWKNLAAALALVRAEMVGVTGAMATMKAGAVALNSVLGKSGWLAILTVIAGAVTYFATATNEMDVLREKIGYVTKETTDDMEKSISRFKELVNTVKDVTTSYKDKKEALDELHRAYGNILSQQDLELENIQKLKGNYDNATQAIREYYSTQLKEKQKAIIDEEMGGKLNDQMANLDKMYTDIVDKLSLTGIKDVSKNEVASVFNSFSAQAKETGVTSAEEFSQQFVVALKKYFDNENQFKYLEHNLSTALIKTGQSMGLGHNTTWLDEYFDIWSDYQNKLSLVTGDVDAFSSHQEKMLHEAIQPARKGLSQLKTDVEVLRTAYSDLYNLIEQQQKTLASGGALSSGDLELKANAILAVQDAWKNLGESHTADEIERDAQNIISIEETIAQAAVLSSQRFASTWEKSLGRYKDATGQIPLAVRNFIEKSNIEMQQFDGTPIQKEIWAIVREISRLYDFDLGTFDWLKTDVKTSFASAAKEVKTKIDEIKESTFQFKQIASISVLANPIAQAEQVTGMTKEEYDRSTKYLQALETLWKNLGGYDKKDAKTKTGRDSTEEDARKRFEFFKRANSEYEKLLKWYGKEEAKMRILNQMRSEAKSLGVEKIFNVADFDKAGTIKNLKSVEDWAKEFLKNYAKHAQSINQELEKNISPLKVELDFLIQQKELDNLSKKIDDLFGGYELDLELKKTGLSKSYLSDLFGIETFSLDELEDRIDAEFIQFINEQQKRELNTNKDTITTIEQARAKAGETELKMYEDNQKKMTDALRKEMQERLKEYSKYLVQAYSQAGQIRLKLVQDLANINTLKDVNGKDIDAETKATMREGVMRDAQKELDKQAWEDFQAGDLYIKMFEDLEKVSTKSLKTMKQKLEEMRNSLKNLDPSQLKEIQTQYNKIDEEIRERNPFKSLSASAKELFTTFKSSKEARKQLKEIGEQLNKLYSKRQQLEAEYSLMTNDNYVKLKTQQEENDVKLENEKAKGSRADEKIIADLEAQKEKIKEQIALLERAAGLKEGETVDINVSTLSSDVSNKSQEISDVNKEIKKTETTQGKVTNDANKWKKALSDTATAIGKINNKVQSIGGGLNNLKSSIEGVFGPMSDGMQDFFDDMNMVLGGLDATANGIQQLASGDYIGGALNTASGLITTIGGLFGAGSHDKKKEREIQSLTKAIDKLKNAYNDLEQAIADAFTFDQLAAGTEQAKANLQEQNEKLEQMIRAESSKKDSDSGKIDEWNQQIKENLRQMKELDIDKINEMGGLADGSALKSQTENFVEAWLSAFKETGDGLKGLEDNFDEFMADLIKKQMVSKVSDIFVSKWAESLNAALESGNTLTTAEVEEIIKNGKEMLPGMSEFLEKLAIAMSEAGLSFGDANNELSGLTKGIQGVTEDTALVVEALLNSMRYYVADTNEQVRRIATLVQNILAPSADNLFVAELRLQTAELKAINNLLASVTKSGHPQGGNGMKVFLN